MIWSLQLFLALFFGSVKDIQVYCSEGCVMLTFTSWVVKTPPHFASRVCLKGLFTEVGNIKMLGVLWESERKTTLVPYHLRTSHLNCVHKMDAEHSLHEKWAATSDHLSKLAQKYKEGTRFVFDLCLVFPLDWSWLWGKLCCLGNFLCSARCLRKSLC